MANWGNILSRGRVEDRRSTPLAVGGLSLTGFAIYLIFNLITGGEVAIPSDQIENLTTQNQSQNLEFEGEDSYEVFASKVLGSNNDLWVNEFKKLNKSYVPPRLVLFRAATDSGCGIANSSIGPHYCPLDSTIYLDETFFEELTQRFGAKGGDVAEAYVISHEAGHHAQNKLGIMKSLGSRPSNEDSIKLELQADCFAGMWANSIKDMNVLEPDEIKEAMDAASAVGDDRIQEKVTGYTNPESWTHGSSKERMDWFNKGFESGNFEKCNTF